ncbi:Protein of unknown function [Mariniphaga anaerophila]|uniref:Outer membrane insertion C-terminal signal n=1 Tax=Mariniphaga anaerophila TaxID=1484053 RepID=A0A1M4Y2F5_9BACT|nr:DUF3078 domain-containing protein [Mariniphaga anaerophila]SHE99868.1 Protein of unknown function [Mariniphaga anaerophila]
MRTLKTFILFIFIATGVVAQDAVKDTTYWKVSGQASVNFSQVSFSHWAGGGKNSVSGVGLFDMNAIYQKNKIQWSNTLKSGYGLLKEEKGQAVKTDDKLEVNSKLGVQLKNEKLLFSSFANFLTQFADGYKYPNTTDKISTFFAPAYLTIASGIDYQPSEKLSLFITPISGKFTFVTDEELSAAGAFGVEPGKKARAEMGATLKGEFKTPVMKNVNLATTLSLFSNYFNNPQNIDVNWDIAVNMKINDYLSANLLTNLVYDHDILVPVDDEGNTGRRIQLKQLFGVGLSYKF